MPATTTCPDPVTSSPVPPPGVPPTAPSATLITRRPDFRQPGAAPRWRVGVGAAVVLVLVLAAVLVGVSGFASARQATSVVEPSPTATAGRVVGEGGPASGTSGVSGSASVAGGSGAGAVFVHLLGHVSRPGLYEVPSGARLVDVVSAAGGLTSDADQSRVNLAEKVVDGAQITVPAVGEPDVPPPSAAAGASGGSAVGAAGTSSGTVDLNTADAAGLEGLPGVGPATAQAILDWRTEHGRFVAIEDLLDVTGIGDKKFDKLREHVSAS